VRPRIPLGTRGRFGDETYEVIGYLARRTIGDGYTWAEYLLHSPTLGARWLVEYNGHWVMTRAAAGMPSTSARGAEYRGVHYRHFQMANAEVAAVVGEFPWAVRVGERALVDDFVAPPLMLSREQSSRETSWSTGEYVDGAAVWAAFGLPGAPPERVGVGAAQPWPHAGQARTMLILLLAFVGAIVLVHLLFAIFSQHRLVADVDGAVVPGAAAETARVSEPFVLGGRTSNVMLEISTSLANSWAYFQLALVDEDTGAARTLGREVGYYFGRDGDGAWSEGSAWDRTYLAAVPAGRYVLVVEAESPTALAWRVRLTRDVPRPLWLWLALAAVAVPPVVVWLRRALFEYRRWQESDHAVATSDDD
jgi:hypothetical protein